MQKDAAEIHFVCHGGKNVENISEERFISGWWPLARRHIRSGVIFALHERASEPSYLQGRLDGSWDQNPNGRMSVGVIRSPTQVAWPDGPHSGFGAYLYSESLSPSGDEIDTPVPGSDFPDRALGTRLDYRRDRAVRVEVIRRANGCCEYCGAPGFETSKGRRYLECHHIIALANDGEDRTSNVIALCPLHHRQAHFGKDGVELEERMQAIVRDKISSTLSASTVKRQN